MTSKESRLTKVRDFNLIMNHGRWANGSFLNLKYLNLGKLDPKFFPKKVQPRTEPQGGSGAGEDSDKFAKQLKLAITVGTKVSKSAVKRNRAKRQIREALRLLIKAGRLKPGFYGLIVAKPEVLTKNYAEISKEVELLMKRSGII